MRLIDHSGIVFGLMMGLLASCGTQDRASASVDQGRDTPIAEAAQVAANANPIAIEFFTSQGCSSCPPADRLAGELVHNPGLVIVSRPVTYWDRLGWRDTLAREENTELQRAYAGRLVSGGGRSYTPQAVVNGQAGLVGSRRRELMAAIVDAQAAQRDISIHVQNEGVAGYRVTIRGTPQRSATVRLLALDSSETVNIGLGENTGHSVTYINVLRDERDLAEWPGGNLAISIDSNDLVSDDSDRRAIIVRDGIAGPILAARYLES